MMMLEVKMRHFWVALPLVVMGLLVTVSCERDEMGEVVRLSSNRILYSVGWADGSAAAGGATKSGGEAVQESAPSNGGKEFLMAYGQDSLFLYMYQEQNRSFTQAVADTLAQTKASAITAVSSFNVAAFTNAGNTFIPKEQISVDGSGNGSSDRYWPESEPLNFFAWGSSVTPSFGTANEAVTPDLTVSTSGAVTTCGGSFSYTLPDQGADPAKATDAVNQPDLIFAISTNQTKSTSSGTVNMQFHHALAAIHFKVGQMPAGLTIKSISIKGVNSSGSCSFIPDSSVPEKPLDLDFTWTDQTGAVNYTQNFNLGNDGSGNTFDQMTGGNPEAVFMMIPQTISDAAELEITFEVKSPVQSSGTYDVNEYTLSKKFSEITNGAEWDADKKYVYVISTPMEVDVEITDQVEGYVKDNLVIKNTGLATSYIRAAIVGNWILKRTGSDGVTTEDIVADWNSAQVSAGGDGDFAGLPGANWKMGTDGFYYYKNQVASQAEITDKLFTSYTLTASPPVVGAELRLSILVQAVIADRIEEAGWPVTVTDGVMTVN